MTDPESGETERYEERQRAFRDRRDRAIDSVHQQMVTTARSARQAVGELRDLTGQSISRAHEMESLRLALEDMEAVCGLLRRAGVLVQGAKAEETS